jgi:ssDNA-binding Zn-finger/Zn-ribbon topoisomerase 1
VNDGLLLIVFLTAMALMALYKTFLKPKLKGIYGESIVALQLSQLSSKKYKILNDVLIQNDVRSSQIDHIVVSNYGVFVIETKNFSGWIFGNEHSNNWTKTLYKKKYHFRNPILQAWGHITTLKAVLSDCHHTPYFPIVVFTGNSTLRNIKANVPVVKTGGLIRHIKNESNTEHLSNEAVDQIYNKLVRLNKTDKASRKFHIRKAKSYHGRDVKSRTCPGCGSNLIEKTAKKGFSAGKQFLGCSNYPICRFAKSM